MASSDPGLADAQNAPTVTLERGARSDAASEAGELPPPAHDLVGRRLLHFRVVARLGAGGMGVVYKAVDEKLHRQVALKVLGDGRGGDSGDRQLLLNEARSAAAISHTNVAAIHEVNDTGDVGFIAMEYVDGESLRARLSKGPIAVGESLLLGREIAAGLAGAHQTGVVHRDLKPDNVMVTQDGRVKLLDFGLAHLLDGPDDADDDADDERALAPEPSGDAVQGSGVTAQHPRARLVGTPSYMSPEQARGESVDARADVFAFGVTLFELLTGELPFRRVSRRPWEWEAPGDWTPREPLRASLPGIDPRIEAVVARCLAYRRDDRFASGRELLEAMRRSRPGGARSAGRWCSSSSQRWSQRWS
jgi:serine/threonine protein kinase